MSDWLQLTLTVIGSGAFFSFLTVLVNQYFARRRTAAETRGLIASAHKTDSDAQRTEAETMQIYVGEIRTAIQQWADCAKERAEALAENQQLKNTVELLRRENVLKDETITKLHGRKDGH